MNTKEKVIDKSSAKCTSIASMLRLLSEINNNSVINVNDFAETTIFLAQQLDEVAKTLDAANTSTH